MPTIKKIKGSIIMKFLKKNYSLMLIIFAAFIYSNFLIIKFSFSWPVPDTGQTKCYDDKKEIPCPSKGESYYGQDAQYETNKRSYTKLDKNGRTLSDSASSWAMVKDNVTGLIWEVKTNDGSIHDKNNKYKLEGSIIKFWESSIQNFINKLNSSRFGGFSDWRIPNIKELASISNKGIYDPAIDEQFFPNTMSDFYWSSTTNARHTGYAWGVYFGNGNDRYNSKSSAYYVRAVRSGQ